jgi:hypothetical protein
MSHTKQDIRERVWQALEKARVHRFPGTRGRIPNFVGAERAADRLCELDIWKCPKVLKCNPDSQTNVTVREFGRLWKPVYKCRRPGRIGKATAFGSNRRRTCSSPKIPSRKAQVRFGGFSPT